MYHNYNNPFGSELYTSTSILPSSTSYSSTPGFTTSTPNNSSSFESDMVENCVKLSILGAIAVTCGYIEVTLVTIAGQNIVHRLKQKSFKAVLRQNTAWYDQQQSGQLQNRLVEDLEKVRLGVSDKIALSIQNLSSFIAGITLGFYYSWKLAAVICSLLPLMAMAGAATSFFVSGRQSKEQKNYAEASGIAEETLSSMRTVAAFCKQRYHLEKYGVKLRLTKMIGIKKSLFFGLSLGCVFIVMFSSYALAFWYGPRLIAAGELDVSGMMTAFFSVLIGAMSIGNAFPGLNDIAMCKGAAAFLIAVNKRKPPIDCFDESGVKPSTVKGKISFRNINFWYPTRPDVQVLKKVSFDVNQGETVALVGHSGCGKSTCVSMVQRFHNPTEGEVTLDGVDLRSINIQWLRRQIGLVSQEPVLFGYTIAENIAFGREGATLDDIERAAKMANAHDFIMNFENGYDTDVGERGTQLSGGQKQRIAIARALIRDPSILLLDEATSALDTESEKVVQDALNKASKGRTTIVIAHRLSTIRNATKIIAFENGVIKEEGNHDQLMALDGVYAGLVRKQNLKAMETTEEEKNQAMASIAFQRQDSNRSQKKLSRSRKFSRMSVSSQRTDEEALIDPDSSEQKQSRPGFGALLKLNSPEWYWIILASIAATMVSGAFPVFSIFFGEMIGVLSNEATMLHDSIFWSCMFLVLGGVIGSGFAMEMLFLAISGEKLTERLRYTVFESFIEQDIEFFDKADNSTGALTAKLAKDASLIQGATGVRLKSVFEAMTGMVVGLVIAFYYGWQLALLILAAVPLITFSGAIQARIATGYQVQDSSNTQKGGKIIVESISNIRTVHAFGLERQFIDDYNAIIDPLHKKDVKLAHVFGITNGLGFSLQYFIYAAAFRLATHLIVNGKMDPPEDAFKVIFALLFAAFGVGQSTAFLPDFAKAQVAADNVLKQLATEPLIGNDSRSTKSAKNIQGNITFSDIHFFYPERKNQKILNGLTLNVKSGQKVALVGYSGCGKSTLMQLIMRFYDPTKGQVTIDGEDIRNFDITSLRSTMAIVSQEPTLFQGSIFENIAYGLEDSHSATLDQVKTAAELANVAKFVSELPDQYNTQVGEKGVQLSGGQKQRLAIARALMRQPKILLLDEATSALDTQSEKIVQEALDRAQEGRTCLVIAHRLSTIQECDQIAVVDFGQIQELGTHTELLAKGGIYASLCNQQNLQKH
ncbi:ATP-dependent translocase ABCB1-like isoform X2 [Convolutriloba macropyga]